MKSDISPMFLTYFMLKWDEVRQSDCDQKCTDCGGPLKRTEPVEDKKGQRYEGYVCHSDKRVTWVKVP